MIVIPAVDLRAGQAVRLAEGDPERMTVYSDSPVELVERFSAAGARRLHIVDLDGAFGGGCGQGDLVRAMIARAHELGAQVEVGGGIRSEAAIESMLAAGADLVIIGTLAVREPELVAELCRRHPGRLVIAIDARDGIVATHGWTAQSELRAADLASDAASWGAGALLFTDIARDGLQGGPNVEATARLQADLEIPVIASGGVGSLADLTALRDAGIQAVVLGRALYEGSVVLEEALAQC
jgi:phosphoribosylformimino-5-aminoimidazole carboxamide ribotide isomerase